MIKKNDGKIRVGTRIQKLDKQTWKVISDDGMVIRKTKSLVVVQFRNETVEIRLNKTGSINQCLGLYTYQPK